MRRINLAVLCPIPNDVLSFWRGVGPLAELRRDNPDSLTLCFFNEISWHSAACVDAAFMQRPFTEKHLTSAQLLKANRVPLWVDFDDDLFSVPSWNPCASTYARPGVQKNIAEIIALADVVTVSTQLLAQKFMPLNKNIIVIPNALNTRLIGEAQPPQQQNRNLIIWRGSKTHLKDLNLMADAAIDLSRRYPEMTWLFLGESPWFADFMPPKSVISAEAIDPVEYFNFLSVVRPSILVAPLVDCDFNRAKSNIAWLEASWAGAAVLAPRFAEWQQPGLTTYREPADLRTRLEEMIVTRMSSGIDSASQSWNHIRRHLTLDTVNYQRIDVIEGMLNGTYKADEPSRNHARRELSGNDVSELRRLFA